MTPRQNDQIRGFTLIEMLIVVAIIGILAAIGIGKYEALQRKSGESVTKGNLGAIRSTISIYFSDNNGFYPSDDLTSLLINSRYMQSIPLARTMPYHGDYLSVVAETSVTDTGGWSYNNSEGSPTWGSVRVGCAHNDTRGVPWSRF